MNSASGATDADPFGDAGDAMARRRDRALLDAMADGVYRLNPDLEFVAVDDAFAATTGYSRDDLVGSHVSLVVGDDDVTQLEGAIGDERESPDAGRVDVSVRTGTGEVVECVTWLSPLSADAEPPGSVGVLRCEDGTVDAGGRSTAAAGSESVDDAPRTSIDASASGSGVDSAEASPDVSRSALRTALSKTDGAAILLNDEFEVVWADDTIGTYFGLDAGDLIGRDKRRVVREMVKGTVENSEEFAERVLATYDDNTYAEAFQVHVTAGDGRAERWLEHRSRPITAGDYAGGRIECYTDVSERKESADALRETEAEFDSLVDAVEEYAIFRLDSDGTVTTWNAGAEAIKGYAADEVVGEHISTFYTKADRAAGVPERNLQTAVEAGSVEDQGWRVRKDGSRFWANVTITAIRGDDGSHDGFLKVTRDMTEQYQRQRDLESELHHILERVSDGFFGLDDEWRFSYINERAAELIEVSMEEATGEVIWELFPETVDSPFEEHYRRAMREQEAVSFEAHFPPLGTWFEVSAYPSETGLSVYFRDVSERRERERALRAREQELEAYKTYTDDILNAIDDLFYVFDREGGLLRWNETVRSVTGYSDADIEAMAPLEFVVEEDRERVARSIGETFRTGNARLEARLEAKDGHHVPIEFVASSVNAPRNERVIAGIGRDVTERKRRQRQLEESNERLEQFAYAASHDLQEPLRMVSSYLTLIENRYEDALDEDGEEFLEFAVDGADRMREMIDGLLAYSRIESKGKSFEPVDLNEVVDDVLETLQLRCDESDATVDVEPLPEVVGDRGQLRQLFQNLLDNAIAYSGDEPPRIAISAERECDEWRVSVADDGIGIDPADADRVFEVFQSLENSTGQHSGIGLALCKRIVERHGGDIEVDSSPGEGATFSFTLGAVGDDDE